MAEHTEISWCDSSWSAWIGCTKISPACDFCYASALNTRFAAGRNWGHGAPRRRTADANWRFPRSWQKNAPKFFAQHGRRQSVFLNNQADSLDNEVDDALRREVFDLIEATPDLDWLLLTKRIGNAETMFPVVWLAGGWPPNVRLGITLCNDEEMRRDLAKLIRIDCPNFVSLEPLLGPIDLNIEWLTLKLGTYPFKGLESECRTKVIDMLDWVVVGAESGPKARPAHLEWIRSIVEQSKAAHVPVHVKQLGHRVLDDGMSSPGGHWPAGIVREPIPRFHENDPPFVVRLKHSKGGDPMEWPDDLRLQQFPEAR